MTRDSLPKMIGSPGKIVFTGTLLVLAVLGGCLAIGPPGTASNSSASHPSAHVQAVRLATRDFRLEIRPPKAEAVKELPLSQPTETVDCQPKVDRATFFVVRGTLMQVFDYLRDRVSGDHLAVEIGRQRGKTFLAAIGFQGLIPTEHDRPLYNGFGYTLKPGGSNLVDLRIDASVVPEGASCVEAHNA